jgi:hypothetical protein
MTRLTTQSVTLSRLQRDGVREHIGHIISRDGNSLDVGGVDREIAMTAIGHLIGGFRILEQLGWQEHGDRDAYTLEVDDDLAAFMGELGRQADEAVMDDLQGPQPDPYIDLDRATVDAAHIVKTGVMAAPVLTMHCGGTDPEEQT